MSVAPFPSPSRSLSSFPASSWPELKAQHLFKVTSLKTHCSQSIAERWSLSRIPPGSLRGKKLLSQATADSIILTCCLSLHGLFLTWPFLGELFSLIVLIQSTSARTCAYTRRPWGLLTLAPRHPAELGMSLPSMALCLKHLHSVHKAKSIRSSQKPMACH